ncbi:acetyl esterase [Williamsia limnetica]|uniref:Acetyl esterase n=1 Tax=Williamsia limnetica TaxID=882452 RepID=A0A318RGU5_WILLI|nr:alpha/beta hydrolase [Williamsia limnetica]PYE12453.1 acetyl esterase [Williamsia limnetica]
MTSTRPARWPVDPQIRRLLEQSAGAPGLHQIPLADARARVSAIRGLLPPAPPVHSVRDRVLPRAGGVVPFRTYLPTPSSRRGTILYFHGGGWTLGGIEDSDGYCRHLAVASGHRVISVGYRLAPEHPYPAALDDARAALEWVARECPGDSIVLGGDSAGGNLATVTTLYAGDQGLPVTGQVLIYPVVDTDDSRDSFAEFGGPGLLMTEADMAWFWDNYAPDPAVRSRAEISPLHAPDLRRSPSTLLVVAEHDILRDGALEYAAMLATHGVEVRIKRYPNMIHGFAPLIGLVDDADDALTEVADYCRDALARR